MFIWLRECYESKMDSSNGRNPLQHKLPHRQGLRESAADLASNGDVCFPCSTGLSSTQSSVSAGSFLFRCCILRVFGGMVGRLPSSTQLSVSTGSFLSRCCILRVFGGMVGGFPSSTQSSVSAGSFLFRCCILRVFGGMVGGLPSSLSLLLAAVSLWGISSLPPVTGPQCLLITVGVHWTAALWLPLYSSVL